MPTETERTRKALLRAARKAGNPNLLPPIVRTALRNPYFPLTYSLRNLLALRQEPAWRGATPRVWRRHLSRLLEERSRIFLEVAKWRSDRKDVSGPDKAFSPSHRAHEPSGYCDHCGGCCEIASGFPDFPPETVLPEHWKRIFGNGLGSGHRFCGFLWELNASGRSLCAIHPWRPFPCRLFEQAECSFFKNDLKTNPPYAREDFSMACYRLARLVNRC